MRLPLKFITLPIVIIAFSINAGVVLAYGQNSVHPALTNAIAGLHNSQSANPLSEQEIAWLKEGSASEDNGVRWLNHAYDPVHNRTWNYPGPFAVLNYFDSTAKVWAQNENAQITYGNERAYTLIDPVSKAASVFTGSKSLANNQTWQRALYEYARGNKQGAMFALGHVLHLIEDMTVPAHTRANIHISYLGEMATGYYEQYADRAVGQLPDILRSLIAEAGRPRQISNLDNYFDENARYSNNYFYSEDTIRSSDYRLPEPQYDRAEGKYLLGLDENRNLFKLAFRESKLRVLSGPDTLTLDNDIVLQDYWSRLSQKAIVNGAGVIDLFFREAEELKEKASRDPKALTDMNLSWLERQSAAVRTIVDNAAGALGLKSPPSSTSAPSSTLVATVPPPSSPVASPSPSPRISPLQSPAPLPSSAITRTPAPTSSPSPIPEPTPSPSSLPMPTPSVSLDSSTISELSTTSSFGGGSSGTTASTRSLSLIPTPSPSPSPTPYESPSATPTPIEEPIPTPLPSPTPTATSLINIFINEIQLSGVTATDEFIELYNPNNNPVDLSHWELRKKTANATTSTPLVDDDDFIGIIPAHGFFLIAHRTSYTATVTPDIKYSGQSHSVAPDNTVLLFDAEGRLVDKVGMGTASDFETQAVANPPPKQSIERRRSNNQPLDTDNNAADFTIDTAPTPHNSSLGTLAQLNIQSSNDEYFDNVAWYFDENDILTIEFDWLKTDVVPGSPDANGHIIQAAWNTDLVSTLYIYPRWRPYWTSRNTGC